jgi:hypothetical protein
MRRRRTVRWSSRQGGTPNEVDIVDYRALAELVMMGLVGLSVLTLALGLSVRVFLAPTLREIFARLGRSRPDDGALAARLERMEDRIADMERGLERLEAAQRFDRELERPSK